MSLRGFDELKESASRVTQPVRIAVAGADDDTVLLAMAEATAHRWVSPVLFGPENKIRAVAETHCVDLSMFEIVDTDEPAMEAVASVRAGSAQLLIKGQIATPALMKAVLNSERGLRTGTAICQVVLMEIPRHDRRFLMADTGITISPKIEQLSQIVDSTVRLARSLGCPVPQVGMMAASEKVSDAMPETHLADQLRTFRAGDDCQISGPLSFDLAYSVIAGERKRLSGDGIGAVDVMVFPNLLSANLTVKAMMYAADCLFGGVLMGAACPIVFMSRADDVPTRIRSLALALSLLQDAETERIVST